MRQQAPTNDARMRLSSSLCLARSIHMLDLLYAYVYCKQLYNGEWGSSSHDATDVAHCALQLSTVLMDPAAAAGSMSVSSDAASTEQAATCWSLLCVCVFLPVFVSQVNSSLQCSLAPGVFDSAKFSIDVLGGCASILKYVQPTTELAFAARNHTPLRHLFGRLSHGPLRALCDLHSLFERAARAKSPSKRTQNGSATRMAKAARRQVAASSRKLRFFVV